MQTADLAVCRHKPADDEVAALEPFAAFKLRELLTPVPGSDTMFTLPKSDIRAMLESTPGANYLAFFIPCTTFDYGLRVMDNCVHVTVYDAGSNCQRASATYSTMKGVQDLLDAIIADGQLAADA